MFSRVFPYFILKERDFALSAQQKELLQKEQQKAASSMEMDEANNQQQVLKNELVQICQSLQEVSDKFTTLTRKKERSQIYIERKEIKQEKILAALTSKPSKELVSEMVYDVRMSILDLKEDLQHLDLEISQQRAKEERVKQELATKEKEADENSQALEDLKEKQRLFTSELDSQKETLAEDVRQAENRQEELNHILQEILQSLQSITKKLADLAEKKEQLEKEITEKEKLQKELISKKALIGDSGIFEKVKADIQASIDKERKSLEQVEAEIEQHRRMKKRLKKEEKRLKKEVDENERFVCELRKRHSVICEALETKRKIFDRQLLQKHQTKEKVQEERKVSASCVTEKAFFQNFHCM